MERAMNPDDQNRKRLKKAKDEILAVFKKYDCAGYVVMHRPGWTEVFWDIKPSYSILRGDLPSVRIRSKLLEDFGGDVEKQKFNNEQTCQMIHGLAGHMGFNAMTFLELDNVLTVKLNPEHVYVDSGFIPDPAPIDDDVH